MALPPRRGGAHQTEVSEAGTESPSGAIDRPRHARMSRAQPQQPRRAVQQMRRVIGAEAAGDPAGMVRRYSTSVSPNRRCHLLVSCDTQEEIDYSWDRLSAVPEA